MTPPKAPAAIDPAISRILSYGADAVGAIAGVTTELLSGPGGAGSIVAVGVSSGIKEIAARTLAISEERRIGIAAFTALHRISARLVIGDAPRDDGFFQHAGTGRSPSDEILEGVLLRARDEYQERKLKHFGNFFAELAFTPEISAETAHLLLRTLERLTYRQLCIVAIVGNHGSLNVEPLRKPEHHEPELESLKREEMDLHAYDLGSLGLLSPNGAYVDTLSPLGKVLYGLTSLREIDPAELEKLTDTLTGRASR